MEFINPEKPFNVSAEKAHEMILESFKTREISVPTVESYLPSARTLSLRVQYTDLLTPWQSALQGLRLSDFNGTPRILIRAGTQVSWSKPLEGNYSSLVYQFLDFLDTSLSTFVRMLDLDPISPRGYSLETCSKLLVESFISEAKPSVLPRVLWPEPSVCAKMTEEALPHFPYQTSSDSGRTVINRAGDEFIYEIFGERGELEFELRSKDKVDFFNSVFHRRLNTEWLSEDRRSQFDYVTLK